MVICVIRPRPPLVLEIGQKLWQNQPNSSTSLPCALRDSSLLLNFCWVTDENLSFWTVIDTIRHRCGVSAILALSAY